MLFDLIDDGDDDEGDLGFGGKIRLMSEIEVTICFRFEFINENDAAIFSSSLLFANIAERISRLTFSGVGRMWRATQLPEAIST